MANYAAYIPAVGAIDYPTQISNFITISEAIDTEVENARNGEANLLANLNTKLPLAGGTLTGGLTLSSGTITIGTDVVAVIDAALTNGNIVSADSSGRITTSLGIVATNIATLSGTNIFTSVPAFNGGTSGTSAPFSVDSTFLVTKLNVQYLNNWSSDSYCRLDTPQIFTSVPVFNGGTSGASAPFSVDSTFLVTNLNADLLDGQEGTYYAPIASPTFTGTPSLPTGTIGITQAVGNDSTSLATTAHVLAAFDLINALRVTEKRVSASPTTTYTADLSTASFFVLTLGGNTTISFSNVPATTLTTTVTFRLVQDSTGNRVPSWPASIRWDGGVEPTWGTADGNEDVVTMFTEDGATIWRANLVGQNYA